MSWRDFFKSTHSLWLEELIRVNEARHREEMAILRDQHEKEIARIEAVNLDAVCVALARIEELKKTHADRLSHVIEENQKLRDDLDRVRLLLTPALQSVELPKERTEPPKPSEIPTGTPWQRVKAEHAKKLREEEANTTTIAGRKFVKLPSEGESTANAIQRNDT